MEAFGIIRSIGTVRALVHEKISYNDRKFIKCVQLDIENECLIFKAGREISAKDLCDFNIGDHVLISFEIKGKIYSGFQQTYLKLLNICNK